MALSIYNTDVMLEAIKTGKKATSFLSNRYFPETNRSEFLTGDVLIEYKNGNQKAAPFVVPRNGGIPIERKGYTVNRYTPANIEISKILRLEDLEHKGFGEALYSNETPETREQLLLAEDLVELDEMITRRQEIMAADVMINNKIVMKPIMPDGTEMEEEEIRYYQGSTNPQSFAPETEWNAEGATIIEDIFAMCEIASEKGVNPTDLIVTPSVMAAIRKDANLIKLLDTKNYNLGTIDPQQQFDGATLLGKFNADGYMLNLFLYNEKYEDEDGNMKAYIPDGYVVVAAPATGQVVYGAVSQMEEADRRIHTYAGRRVPKHTTNVEGDASKIKLTSKPLLAPKAVGGWVSAQAITVA